MSGFTQADIVNALSGCQKQVRNEVGVVYAILHEVCRSALATDTKVAENYLQRRALNVYRHANTNELLEALWLSMRALYSFKSDTQELIQPAEFRPLRHQETVINEGNPVLLLQMLLERALDEAITSSDFYQRSEAERYLLHALLIARGTHITEEAVLVSLLSAEQSQLLCFSDLNRASLLIEKPSRQRVWLDAVSLLHWRRARESRGKITTRQHLKEAFKRWWHLARANETLLAHTELSLDDALLAINFQTRPIAAASLANVTTPLSDESLVFAVSGQRLTRESQSQTYHLTRKRQRKTAVAALVNAFSDSDKRFSIAAQQRLAYSPAHRSENADRQLIDALRNLLSDYAKRTHENTRSGKTFLNARERIERLLTNALAEKGEQAPSVVAQLLALFCADLFINGSPTKETLRPGSIKSYLSTLTVFVSESLNDEKLLVAAQSSAGALYELTHALAGAISDLYAADKQSTVLRFLQYVHEISELQLYDFDELELSGVTVESVRAHFIPAQIFDTACHSFLAMPSSAREQTVLMMRLCYYCGLRRNEALMLNVDDISVDSDVLYVTKIAGRKTLNAPRKLPLALLPNALYTSLLEYAEKRGRTHQRLFDEQAVEVHEREFITWLREQTYISDLVVHSLRHSAANNLLLVFAQGAFPSIQPVIAKYFLTQQRKDGDDNIERHELFSLQQLERLRQAFLAEGRTLNSYFPILDFLAMMLGHATPGTSAASYLHFFELVTFELSSLRSTVIDKKALLNVLTRTNARFETQKQFVLSREPESTLFKSASFGLKKAGKFKTRVQTASTGSSQRLSFSDFCDALYDYQYRPASELSIDKSLRLYFDSLNEAPDLSPLENLSSRAYPAWIRLLERMSKQRWHAVQRNAIIALKDSCTQKTISDKRSVEQILRAFKILQIKDCSIELSCENDAWRALIERHGYKVRLKQIEQSEDKLRIEMRVKPFQLRWPLWEQLPWILQTLELYSAFCNLAGETEA